VSWQVKYALANFAKDGPSVAEHLGGDVIRIVTDNRPDVVAAISAVRTVDQATAAGYRDRVEGLDFLCRYRAACVWEGEAIRYLEDNQVGWGIALARSTSSGTPIRMARRSPRRTTPEGSWGAR